MPTTIFDPRKNVKGQEVIKGRFVGEAQIRQTPRAPGHVSNMVIDPTRPFYIDLEWEIDGDIGEVNSLLNDIGDNKRPDTKVFHVYVYAEKMGPGEDRQIYHNKTPDNSVTPVQNLPARWKHTCEIPANSLEQHLPGSGMYKLCTVVWADAFIKGIHDIVGCEEGPMILVEQPN